MHLQRARRRLRLSILAITGARQRGDNESKSENHTWLKVTATRSSAEGVGAAMAGVRVCSCQLLGSLEMKSSCLHSTLLV